MWYNINRTGRLGNRLFSRAHVYAAALEFGETVIDWGLIDIKEHFPNIKEKRLPIYPFNRSINITNLSSKLLSRELTLKTINKFRPRMTGEFHNFWNEHYGVGDKERMRLDSTKFKIFCSKHKNIILNGYKLRCPNWVAKHRIEICKYFEVPQSYLYKWNKLVLNWKNNYSEIIGVHMRRGDFKTAMRGDFYFSPEEYASTLRKIKDINFKDNLVILFSEDRFTTFNSWEKVKNAFSDFNFLLNNGSILDDLSGLIACDKIIGPHTSTFSRWAAYAGNKEWAGIGRESLHDDIPLEFSRCPIPWNY